MSRFRMDWLRFRDRAHSATTAWEYETDARTVDDHPRRLAESPDAGRRLRARRRVVRILLCTVFGAGCLAAVLGDRGFLDHRRLTRESGELERAIAVEEAQVRALERYVDRLEHDPLARERIAREQLDLALPGEVTFLLPESGTSLDPTPAPPNPGVPIPPR